ncbi:uncharacterized protein [Fopius arisanus]|uniref:Uncharacterized protein n=1 Tax=Fopius arisanus TaxID=64838 RepID=A0A9R1SZJ6_9HYME|nr:PREDICTED: uncharacterized protein LOC105264839 [Fopius arisanus]
MATPEERRENDGDEGEEGDLEEAEDQRKGKNSGESNSPLTDFESVSVPSRVVQDLLEKKREMHEVTIKEMQVALIAIQENYRNKFEALGNQLTSNIDEIRREIREIQGNFTSDINRFNAAEHAKVDDRLTSLLGVESSLITEFHKKICKNERMRTLSVRRTLKKFREKLRCIAHVPPGALKIPTDEEIEDYNEKIRNNYAIHEELCSKLHLSTSNLESELQNWLKDVKIFKANAS